MLTIADRAHEHLAARFRRMSEAGNAHPKTIVAMARERCGYLWAVLHRVAHVTRPRSA